MSLPRQKFVFVVLIVVITLVAFVSYANHKLQKSLPNASASLSLSQATSPIQSPSQSTKYLSDTQHKEKPDINSSTSEASSEQHFQLRIPSMTDYRCQDSVCSELLSAEQKERYRKCTQRSAENMKPAKCHFINGTGRVPVALTSYQGSGNTWVRGLLEKATGICTGALYCGPEIRREGMAGEFVASGAVLVVKTHRKTVEATLLNYGAAIHLVRNPFDALVAEYNRKMSSGPYKKMNSINKDEFGNNPHWEEFVQVKTRKWKIGTITWTQQRTDMPILQVRYEDIKEDAMREVKRMVEFLGVPYNEEELRERLSEDFTFFQRNKTEDFDHYTPEQRQYVKKMIRETVAIVRANNNGDPLGLDAYAT